MGGIHVRPGLLATFLGAVASGALGLTVVVAIVAMGTGPGHTAMTAGAVDPAVDPAVNDTILMGGVARMPADADCRSCHVNVAGTIASKRIPALAHPLQGWTNCAACHAPERLVPTAPGHSGIHASECLYCHRDSSPAAPPRPHLAVQTTGCLKCHGSSAPLPASMATRSESNCWLCHQSQFAAAVPQPVAGVLSVVIVR